MYERLLDREAPPSDGFIREYLGAEGCGRLFRFEDFLNEHYEIRKELKFPFGSRYGWGYRYGHRSNHLCYAFFEAGAFTVTFQLGDPCVSAVEAMLPALSEKANELWKKRYPCGTRGGWIHDRVTADRDLEDLFALVTIKLRPVRR